MSASRIVVATESARRPRAHDRAEAQRHDAVGRLSLTAGDARSVTGASACAHDRRLVVQRQQPRARRRRDTLPCAASAAINLGDVGHAQAGQRPARAGAAPASLARQLRAPAPSSRAPAPSRRSARPRGCARRSAPGGARGPARHRGTRATRSSRSGKSVTCSRPALRSTLNVACSDSSVCTPLASSREHVGPGRARHARGRCRRRRRRRPSTSPVRSVGDVVDVEDARLGLAPEHADERAVDRVVEAERRQDQAERLADGDVLQLADERAGDRRIGHDAQARAAHEQQQQVLDRHRLREGQREGAVVEVGGERALVELRQRQRRHLRRPLLRRLRRRVAAPSTSTERRQHPAGTARTSQHFGTAMRLARSACRQHS